MSISRERASGTDQGFFFSSRLSPQRKAAITPLETVPCCSWAGQYQQISLATGMGEGLPTHKHTVTHQAAEIRGKQDCGTHKHTQKKKERERKMWKGKTAANKESGRVYRAEKALVWRCCSWLIRWCTMYFVSNPPLRDRCRSPLSFLPLGQSRGLWS